MNAILLHGLPDKEEYYDATIPSCSNSHWFPWLQQQLQVNNIHTQTPEIPNAWRTDYPTWQKEFERYDIGPDTMLVGHSCGGGFIVRWLSEHPAVKVGKVVLVAPWLNPDRSETTDFFDFTIDSNLAERTAGLVIFNSDNDFKSIHTSVKTIRDTVKGVTYREFHNAGHFCFEDLKTLEFPELRDELLDSVK